MNIGSRVKVKEIVFNTVAGESIVSREHFLNKAGIIIDHNYPEEGLLNYVNFGDPYISYGFYDSELELLLED